MTARGTQQKRDDRPAEATALAAAGLVGCLALIFAACAPNHLFLYFEYTKSILVALMILAAGVGLLVTHRSRSVDALSLPFALLAGYALWLTAVTVLRPAWFNGPFVCAKTWMMLAIALTVGHIATVDVIDRFGRWLACLMIAIAVITLAGAAFGWSIAGVSFRLDALRLTFGSANYAACVLVMILPIVVASAITARNTNERIMMILATVATYWLIACTDSRNGLFGGALVASICVFAGLWRGVRTPVPYALAVTAGLLTACALLGVAMSRTESESIVTVVSDASTGDLSGVEVGRRYFYAAAWHHASSSSDALAIGHGAGAFFPLSSGTPASTLDIDPGPRLTVLNVHSEYLEIVVESGLIGLTMFMAAIGVLLLGLVRTASSPRDVTDDASVGRRVHAIAAGCAVLGFLGFGVLSVANRYVSSLAVFGVVIGIGLAVSRTPTIPLRTRWWPVMPIIIGLVSVLIIWPRYDSSRLLSEAIDLRGAATTPAQERRASLIERAVARWPGNIEAQYERLNDAAVRGDAAEIQTAFDAVQRIAPTYQDSHTIVAMTRAAAGDLDGAIDHLRAYTAIHAFDLTAQARLAIFTIFTVDERRVNDALLDLLLLTIEKLNRVTDENYLADIETIEGATVIRIACPDGRTVNIPKSELPWLLLRRSPANNIEAAELLVTHLDTLITDELNAQRPRFMETLHDDLLGSSADNR